jgi:hypothetical protein
MKRGRGDFLTMGLILNSDLVGGDNVKEHQ